MLNEIQHKILQSSVTGVQEFHDKAASFTPDLVKSLTPIVGSSFTYAFSWVMGISALLAIIASTYTPGLVSVKRLKH